MTASSTAMLLPHPDTGTGALHKIEVDIWRGPAGQLGLHFYALGHIDRLEIPARTLSRRRDELWRSTCFEFFGRRAGRDDYIEINAAPSSEWASYHLGSYRNGMSVAEEVVVEVRPQPADGVLHMVLNADLAATLSPTEDWEINLTAIIEELDGAKSYWALAHPPEGPPDFHHPDCFALTLPPPGGA